MRKGLEHKYDAHKLALDGHGVILDAAEGAIYRLDVADDGWCRLWKNELLLDGDAMVGKPLYIWDFGTPERAIAQFESIKKTPGVTWCKDVQFEDWKKILENLISASQEAAANESKRSKERGTKKQKPAQTRRRGRPRVEQLTIDGMDGI